NPHHVAQAVEGIAAFGARYGRLDGALRLVDAANAIRVWIGAPRTPTETLLLKSGAELLSQAPDRRAAASGHYSRDAGDGACAGHVDDGTYAGDDGQVWTIDRAVADALELICVQPHPAASHCLSDPRLPSP